MQELFFHRLDRAAPLGYTANMQSGHLRQPTERLSEGQKQCLRLVVHHHSSKEIARELGISPHTVDQRLKRAAALLQVSSRFEAARILSKAEAGAFLLEDTQSQPVYQSLVYQRPDLPPYVPIDKQGLSEVDTMSVEDMDDTALHDVSHGYFAMPEPRKQYQPFWSALFDGEIENNLTARIRIAAMMLILFVGLLGFAILVSILEGLSRIV
jgi:DNA-binding CsgD family transcriptional regulator